MRFGVLGPLAVWTDDGVPVTVPGLKVRALLADLLVHAGRVVSTDRLVEDLWGDGAPANPAGALQVRVSQLRKALDDAEPGGRALVLSRAPGYLLQAAPRAVDAARFAELTARARVADDPRVRAALLADALALWRGAAYADFADEEFTRHEVTRLQEQRLVVLEEQAETRLALGEHGVLAGELGELVARYPLRERLRAAHLRALYRAGRPAEALESYADLRTRLADELGLDPGVALMALHRDILAQDPSLDPPAPATPPRRPPDAPGPADPTAAAVPVDPPAAVPAVPPTVGNLPAPLTALIGRDDAVAEVGALLRAERLVTLVGPGGVGKTRLAVEIARRQLDAFPGGGWLVELAALDRPRAGDPVDPVVDLVRAVLQLRDPAGPAAPVDQVAGALRERRLLLVLDNCEHVVEQVADLVARLLPVAPSVRVLATSREPLGVAGELRWEVPPLSLPAPGDTDPHGLAGSGAVQLFVARATAAARGFTLDADTAPAVALLCRRLDGIPLALELAATRVRALGVPGLVARLDDRFRLLSTGQRGAPPRQQTLLSVIDWSWDLLTDEERAVLRRLVVGVDGCTLAAAEVVCADRAVPAAVVPDLLTRLVDRSLVVPVERAAADGSGAVEGVDDGPRYRLLESVAAYCAQRLHDAGEAGPVRQRHARYYLGLAERAEPHLYGPDQRRWLRVLDAEAANLLTAFEQLAVVEGAAGPALRMAAALSWYCYLRGRLAQARRSLETALGLPGDGAPAVRARAAAWHAGFAMLRGDTADWAARRAEVLRSLDGVDDPTARARAQWFLGFVCADLADVSASGDLVARALETFRAVGDRWGEAAALSTRAKLAHSRGDLAALRRDAGRSAELFRELGDRWGVLQATEWLAALAEIDGDHAGAAALHRDGLRSAEELGLWSEAAGRLSWLGWIALQVGDLAQARECCGRALRLAVEQGSQPGEVFARLGLGFTARRAGDLDLAEEHLRRLLPPEAAGEPEHPLYEPMVLTELGFVAELRGDIATARDLHTRAFTIARALDAPRDAVYALEGLAAASAAGGEPVRAARLLGAAAAERNSAGFPAGPAERAEIDRATVAARAVLGADGFAAELDRGGRLTPDEAWSQVGRPGAAIAPSAGPGG